MTVCLGLLSPEENAVVVAADRMVTGGRPEVEFEHEGSKIDSEYRSIPDNALTALQISTMVRSF